MPSSLAVGAGRPVGSTESARSNIVDNSIRTIVSREKFRKPHSVRLPTFRMNRPKCGIVGNYLLAFDGVFEGVVDDVRRWHNPPRRYQSRELRQNCDNNRRRFHFVRNLNRFATARATLSSTLEAKQSVRYQLHVDNFLW